MVPDGFRERWMLQVRDAISGKLTLQWETQCQHGVDHYHQLASWNSINTPYLAHSCFMCETVDVYDLLSTQLIMQYRQQGVEPGAICRGPGPDTLLLVEGNEKRILQLQWRGSSLELVNQIPHSHPIQYIPPNICYSSLQDTIYLADFDSISCISLSGDQSGQTLWQLGGNGADVEGQRLGEHLSLCCDLFKRLYLCGWSTGRLLVVHEETGKLLNIHNGLAR